MPHYRSSFRASVKQGFEGDPYFADFTLLSAWAESIDAKSLPVIGIATPTERKTPSTHGSSEVATLLQVVLKRMGGTDIEDLLDEDSTEVERVVKAAIGTREVQCLLEETTTVLNGDGERRIGTLTMSFRVTSWPRASN